MWGGKHGPLKPWRQMVKYREAFKKGWEIFQPFRKAFIVMVLLIMLTEFSWMMGPFLFGKVMNAVAAREPINSTLILASLTFLLSLVGASIGWRRQVYQEKNFDYTLRQFLTSKTLQKILGLSIGQHRSQNSGITRSVIGQGQNSLEQSVGEILYNILPTIAEIVIVLVMMLWFHTGAGLIALGGTVVFAIMTYSATMTFWPKVRSFRDLGHANSKAYNGILENMPLVQVSCQEERVQVEHDKRLQEWVQKGQDTWIPFIMSSLTRTVVVFVMRFAILVVGIISVYRNGFQVGDVAILYMWSNLITMNLWQMANMQRNWLNLWANIKKYFALLDVEPEIRVMRNPIRPVEFQGQIEFRNVSFTYKNQRYIELEDDSKDSNVSPLQPALIDVSFKIEAGQRVAFVGESGAGKTTVISLLYRGWEADTGQVLIDGHDLRLLDLTQYRNSMGLVEQRVQLFDDTLRYNVLFALNGHGQYVTDSKLEDIAEKSRISRFKHRLPDGWETIIGENGLKLSGGEQQRVGIARALAKNPRFLIFDEATSNLDPRNERAIKEAIRNASEGKTTIIIAHRLSTVRDADKIFVMDQGRLVSEGKHEALLLNCPVYQDLVHEQLIAL
jgi:ATP-binding cassette, subfamily B, heavy metal transporter